MTDPIGTRGLAPNVARILASVAVDLRELADHLDAASRCSDGTLTGADRVQADARYAVETLAQAMVDVDRGAAIAQEMADSDRLRMVPDVEPEPGAESEHERILARLAVTPGWTEREAPSDADELAELLDFMDADVRWLLARGFAYRDHLSAYATLRGLSRVANLLDTLTQSIEAAGAVSQGHLLDALRCARSRFIARRAATKGLS